MMNVIFIAPPAAGKGTISEYLVETNGYIHLSTGELLRKVASENTELGRHIAKLMQEGILVEEGIVLKVFESELERIKDKAFILDGIPRKAHQAEYLDNLFKQFGIQKYVVINLDIDENLLTKRITGRRVCSNCGASYNINDDAFRPKMIDSCDICNSKLIQRKDDNEETFKVRYQTYLKETKPLLDYYREKGVLHKIDASKSQQEIRAAVEEIVKGG